MPIKIQNDLPAREILEKENIFVVDENRACHQDIRSLQICILNLMPLKEDTELQLLRSMSNTPLQIDVSFMQMSSHHSTNTSPNHLNRFYHTFDELKDRTFDGMIITGAPVEQMPFEEVDYWKELCGVFEWTKTNVTSTFHICWGARSMNLFLHSTVLRKLRSSVPRHLLIIILAARCTRIWKKANTTLISDETRKIPRDLHHSLRWLMNSDISSVHHLRLSHI